MVLGPGVVGLFWFFMGVRGKITGVGAPRFPGDFDENIVLEFR
jgi:hypothetical protein